KSREAALLAAGSGPNFDGVPSWSIPLVANIGGVKELYVLWMEEPLESHYGRAEIDVHLRHPLALVFSKEAINN
ncbi:hypothetical protein TSMEX_002225, partial [Taenia solium]